MHDVLLLHQKFAYNQANKTNKAENLYQIEALKNTAWKKT